VREIVRAVPKDYEEIVTLSNICFSEDRGAVELRWCHVWGSHLSRPSTKYMDNFYLAKEDGRIVGTIAVCPMVLEWAGERIQAGGISAVATHPDYRGRGIMTQLLHHADRVMARRGDIVSVLGGDRSRYGRFGWEHVGCSTILTFSGKYLERLPDADTAPSLADHRDTASLRRILELYQQREPRFIRTPEQLAVLLQRRGVRFWCLGFGTDRAAGNSGPTAYIGAWDRTVQEYGGERRAVLSLIRYFARTNGAQKLNVAAPVRFSVLDEGIFREAEAYHIQRLFSLKILRFRDLMQKLVPALRMQPRLHCGERQQIRLEVAETGEAAILLSGSGEIGLAAMEASTPTGGVETVRLPGRAMARLLFGPFAEGLIPEEHRARSTLLSLFPLPLACSQIDMV
jgi:GNAT superfamily N-acetyltransferase